METSYVSAARVITTAEACRRFGLTARAMRHYEDRGLLQVERDWLNRRCYDAEAQRRLAWIAALRRARLPLRDVDEVLRAEAVSGAGAEVADEKLRALAADFARLQAVAEEMRRVIASGAASIAA